MDSASVTNLVTALFAFNLLQFSWLIGYKKYLNLRQVVFLTCFLFFQVFSYLFFEIPSSGYFFMPSMYWFIPFSILESIFIVYSLKKIALAAFYITIQNILILLSWLLTWELLNLFWFFRQLGTFITLVVMSQQLLFFALILISKKINSKFKILETIYHLPKKFAEKAIICIVSLFSLIIIRQLILIKFEFVHFFFLIILVFIFTSVFYYILYLISRFYQQQQSIELLSRKFFREEERIELANEFRHDYRNILLSLVTYLEQNQVEEALAYVSSIIDYSNTFIESDYFTYVFMIEIPPVQGLLINFFEKCNEKQVPVDFTVNQKISSENISIGLLDFIRCLSILLDNALEASMTVKKPQIQVIIEVREHSIFVEVKNSFDHTLVFEQILKNNYTTKEEHQGKGLYIFTKLLKQHKKASYLFKQENNLFIANFSLPKKIIVENKTASVD